MSLKSHATIIEIDISVGDLKLNFTPSVGLWFAALNENNSSAKHSYFKNIYNVENIEKQLLDYDNIGGINVEGDRSFIRVYDINTLYKQNKSFMLSTNDNINYIIINFGLVEIGYYKEVIASIKNLYSDRTWLDSHGVETNKYNGISVDPIIENIDHSDIEGNSLTFQTLQTSEMSVTLLNVDGRFDNFNNLFGNRFFVIKQYDAVGTPVANSYSKNVFSGFIEKPEYNFLDSITITASDIRHSYSTTLPARSFNIANYPELSKFPQNVDSGVDTIDTKRTFAAGRGLVIKCTPIKYHSANINDISDKSEVVFEICDTTNNAIECIVEKADKYDNNVIKPRVFFIDSPDDDSSSSDERETVIPEYKDFGNGSEAVWVLDKVKGTLTFTGNNQVKTISKGLTSADSTDYTFSDDLNEIYVEVDIPPYNSLDLIKDLLANYENISYIKENYNLENYENASLYSRETAVLLTNENSKSILDLIGQLCFLEQGRLEIENNLITFNSTKNRTVKAKLNQKKMGRVDKSNESGEYLSSCSVSYDLDKYTHENKLFEYEAKKRHRLTVHEDFSTLLKNKEDAEDLSNEIMQSRYTLKDYYIFEYFDTLDELKLFDLVEMEYKRNEKDYFIKPCICEIVKLNIFDNVIKLRYFSEILAA